MAPPQLARDAPVVNVAHPLEVGLLVLLRRKADVTFFDGSDGHVGERLNLDEPLRGQRALDDVARAFAATDGVGVLLDFDELAARFQIGDDAFACDVAVQSRVVASCCVQVRRVVHHIDGRKIVALAECEVVRIVCGCDLHCAGAELRAYPIVGNDRDDAAGDWLDDLHQVELLYSGRLQDARRRQRHRASSRGAS